MISIAQGKVKCQQPYFEKVGTGITEVLDLEGSGVVFQILKNNARRFTEGRGKRA